MPTHPSGPTCTATGIPRSHKRSRINSTKSHIRHSWDYRTRPPSSWQRSWCNWPRRCPGPADRDKNVAPTTNAVSGLHVGAPTSKSGRPCADRDKNVPPTTTAVSGLPVRTPTSKSGRPGALTRVFYSDDGSTAMEVAIKMALQYWQHRKQPKRTKFVAFADAYHGDTLGVVSVGGIDLFHAAFKPLLFDVLRVGQLSEIEKLMEKKHDQVAAVVIEPLVQGAAGMRLWPRGLLADLRRLCDQYNVLLVADEVLTGFGRTGTMFACEQEDVVPDLMALSKGLTGGYLPLAATLTTEEIFNAFLGEYSEFKTFFHGHSYTGNQLGCAAALASLRVFEEEQVLERLSVLSHQLSVGLDGMRTLPHVVDVRQCGFIGAVEVGPFPIEQKMGMKVSGEMRKRGVLTRPSATP